MKKFLAYLLCLGLLTGCGGNTDKPSDNGSNSIETNQTEANKKRRQRGK